MLKNNLFLCALGVMKAEGYFLPGVNPDYPEGSLSYKNNNPGNLRYSTLQVNNVDNFAVFDSLFIGFIALLYQLELYANGKSGIVSPDATIEAAFSHYTGLAEGSVDLDNYLSDIETETGLSRLEKISILLE